MSKLFVSLIFGFVLLITAKPVEAALVTVNKDGEVVWNVLSLQNELLASEEVEDFSVRQVAQVNNAGNDLINVKQVNGKTQLSVGSGDNVREIEVGDVEDSLIEIEERAATQRLAIGKTADNFTIEQSGTVVNTKLPIQINPKTSRLSLATSTGDNYLYILPKEAIRSVVRAKVITLLRDGEAIEIKELEDKLVYRIPGSKVIPILDIYNYSFNVDSYVSAQTGEIVDVDAPTWYKIFGFLITQQT